MSSVSPPSPAPSQQAPIGRKYKGYRLWLEHDRGRVRLITRGGYNWTSRYSWIVESALKNRHKQFVIDGEAVILGVDGIADFNALVVR